MSKIIVIALDKNGDEDVIIYNPLADKDTITVQESDDKF